MMKTYGTMYYVDDMDASVSFYQNLLGYEPSHRSSDWTEFSFGEHRLCLHAKRSDPSDYPQNGVLILNHDGIKSLYDSLKKKGLNVFGLHQVHPEAWSFHFKDPGENELSYYGRP